MVGYMYMGKYQDLEHLEGFVDGNFEIFQI